MWPLFWVVPHLAPRLTSHWTEQWSINGTKTLGLELCAVHVKEVMASPFDPTITPRGMLAGMNSFHRMSREYTEMAETRSITAQVRLWRGLLLK
jgi:hypothetical protein